MYFGVKSIARDTDEDFHQETGTYASEGNAGLSTECKGLRSSMVKRSAIAWQWKSSE